MPETGQSFALIYSIEDPLGNTPQAGVGLQVMGPDDGYICQFDKRVDSFWASRNNLELGATFKAAPGSGERPVKAMLSEVRNAPAPNAAPHHPPTTACCSHARQCMRLGDIVHLYICVLAQHASTGQKGQLEALHQRSESQPTFGLGIPYPQCAPPTDLCLPHACARRMASPAPLFRAFRPAARGSRAA